MRIAKIISRITAATALASLLALNVPSPPESAVAAETQCELAIFAFRGTSEPQLTSDETKYKGFTTNGWEGDRLGQLLQHFAKDLQASGSKDIVNKIKVIGVGGDDYTAKLEGNLELMVEDTIAFHQAFENSGCPTNGAILLGYSQGAGIATRITSDTLNSGLEVVGGLVTVADPYHIPASWPWAPPSNTGSGSEGTGVGLWAGVILPLLASAPGIKEAINVASSRKVTDSIIPEWVKPVELKNRYDICLNGDTICDFSIASAPYFNISIDPSLFVLEVLRLATTGMTVHGSYFQKDAEENQDAIYGGRQLAGIVKNALIEDEASKDYTRPLQVALVIDTTRSMTDYLEDAKSQAKATAEGIFSQNGSVSIIDYRDFYPEVDFASRIPTGCEFVTTVEAVQSCLDQLVIAPENSRETPETVYCGIGTAIMRLPWAKESIRDIVVIGDAAPKEPADSSQLSLKDIETMMRTPTIWGSLASTNLTFPGCPAPDLVESTEALDSVRVDKNQQGGPIVNVQDEVGLSAVISVVAAPSATSWFSTEVPNPMSGSASMQSLVETTGGVFVTDVQAKKSGFSSSLIDSIETVVASAPDNPVALVSAPSEVFVDEPFAIDGLWSKHVGEEAKFEFDFDGNGTYELSSKVGVIEHTFEKAGYFQIGMRVTDSKNRVATTKITVKAVKQQDVTIPFDPEDKSSQLPGASLSTNTAEVGQDIQVFVKGLDSSENWTIRFVPEGEEKPWETSPTAMAGLFDAKAGKSGQDVRVDEALVPGKYRALVLTNNLRWADAGVLEVKPPVDYASIVLIAGIGVAVVILILTGWLAYRRLKKERLQG
ncbi:MAG: hypothetical protein RR877_03695 [Aurantimicrobium sp.]|uniref:hypothetical protein n=1 Tax=Aurantimicrobium sp. TaxID=1930784 RepID=UPI002FC59BF5